MARSYTGGKTTPHYYNIDAAAPIDNRFVVQTLNDLYKEDTWRSQVDEDDENLYLYEGLIVYVQEEKTAYILKDIEKYSSAEGWKIAGAEVVDMYKYIEDNNGTEGINEDAALSVGSGVRLLRDKVGLDETGKIPISVLPDNVVSGLIYGGTVTIQLDGNPTVTTISQAFKDLSDGEVAEGNPLTSQLAIKYPNVFFIVNLVLEVDSNFSVGDWLISSGQIWEHIKQSNNVSSVCGLTGVITTEKLVGKLTNDGLDDNVELVTVKEAKSIAYSQVSEVLKWIDISSPKTE
jgi:hypothetical protein